MARSERTKKALELLKAVEDIDTSASRTTPRIHLAAGFWWGTTAMSDREKNENLVELLVLLAERIKF